MAIKTFTTGEVLTAADTNTYLANSGLVFVKQQTVGSGVSSVTVSDAFNSTYENYEIIYTGGTQSTTQSLNLRLGTSNTNYFNVLIYAAWSGGAVSTVGNQNANDWVFMGYGNTTNAWLKVSLFQPFLAKNTFLSSPHAQFSANVGGYNAGFLNDTTSHTEFTITPAGGTLTGGTISVYGYRKG
jgi:hypothetical protein